MNFIFSKTTYRGGGYRIKAAGATVPFFSIITTYRMVEHYISPPYGGVAQ